MEDLATKFDGFDAIMQKVLDKVTGLETWRSSADASMDALLAKADDTATRLRRLESAPPPPPPPPPRRPAVQFPPPPPPAWMNPFDLNLAPEAATRPSTSTAERPSGHGFDASIRVAGGGILGSAPPRPVTDAAAEGAVYEVIAGPQEQRGQIQQENCEHPAQGPAEPSVEQQPEGPAHIDFCPCCAKFVRLDAEGWNVEDPGA